MRTIVIDSSTERSILALLSGKDLFAYEELPFGHQSSKYLFPTLQRILHKAKIGLKQLSRVVVGIGPGSYTGIRVGVAVGKMLAYSLKIPIASVSSLEGFIPPVDGPFAAIIDARSCGAYLLKGEKKDQTITFFGRPAVYPSKALPQILQNVDILVTPKKDRLFTKVTGSIPKSKFEWFERPPCPIHLNERGQNSKDIDILYPKHGP